MCRFFYRPQKKGVLKNHNHHLKLKILPLYDTFG
ncbi:Hypothetical Protein SLY_0137 [Strawberry lethal yellows phytoplasma (CPA) str. NZSb11]|uniref:Uncharacterized protein n=1 Tax=Strawberry lethal yellows phytoplasma (CPA) str. NZSb11 TaxID=980422 RepID=R4RNL8_PHYAS|nr:Hypothetical Protein SLY_0032 [Strawberry lethal yellows phytoplasma (CPA) str. NZSb11]AGL90061.1 Hypothetical Protein SLY_0137 [Strawberry lethal yellows phytoplasma (CPA) str. NZSb11]